jgi:hypothetical protein
MLQYCVEWGWERFERRYFNDLVELWSCCLIHCHAVWSQSDKKPNLVTFHSFLFQWWIGIWMWSGFWESPQFWLSFQHTLVLTSTKTVGDLYPSSSIFITSNELKFVFAVILIDFKLIIAGKTNYFVVSNRCWPL